MTQSNWMRPLAFAAIAVLLVATVYGVFKAFQEVETPLPEEQLFGGSASWPATDDFESYTDGASLNGAAGGSGWNGNWTILGTGGTVTASIDNPQAGANSGKFVASGGVDPRINRAVSAATTGEVEYYIRTTATGKSYYINLSDATGAGAGAKVLGGFEGTNIVFYDNGTGRIVFTTYAANTWYGIRIKYNGSTNKFNIATTTGGSTTFGAYSPDYTYSFGGTGDITNYQFYSGTNGTYYFDTIAPVTAAAAATPDTTYFEVL